MLVQKATKCKQLMLQEYIVTMCTFTYRVPAIGRENSLSPEAEKSYKQPKTDIL